jgi:osmotically-inducible protein OsmY
MEKYRNVALSALLGVFSFASLAAYDSYSQGDTAYRQQGGWVRGQDGSYYQQDGYYYQDQGGHYQQDGSQRQYYQDQGGYGGQQRGYYQDDGSQGCRCENQYDRQSQNNRSQMQYSPNDTSDDAVAARVRNALQKDTTLSSSRNVQVAVDDGKVTLTGTVKNDDEKSKIETIAKQVSGVKSVSNKVTVAK